MSPVIGTAGPVYMRPPLHSRIPSADIGALNLHEYFSPLSTGMHITPQSAGHSNTNPGRARRSEQDCSQLTICGDCLGEILLLMTVKSSVRMQICSPDGSFTLLGLLEAALRYLLSGHHRKYEHWFQAMKYQACTSVEPFQ